MNGDDDGRDDPIRDDAILEDSNPDNATSNDATSNDGPGAPTWLIWSMIVLASLIAIGAGLNTWMNRGFLDTDNWVETSGEVLSDDDVRLALSNFLVEELYAKVDVSSNLASELPDALKPLAVPISGAIRSSATTAVDRLLGTERAQAIWERTNRIAHEKLVNVLQDDTVDAVSTSGGTVTLELGDLVRELGTELGLPTSLIDRIPADAGQVVVAESNELEDAQLAVKVIEILSVVLFVIVVALYAGAVYLARGRRRTTLRNVGWSLFLSGVVLLVVQRITVNTATDRLSSSTDVKSAIRAVAEISTNLLTEVAWLGIAVGLLIVVYAIFIGPSRAAVGTRRALAPVLRNTIGVWVVAILVLVVLATLTPAEEISSRLSRIVFVVLFVVAVETIRRQVRREHPTALPVD